MVDTPVAYDHRPGQGRRLMERLRALSDPDYLPALDPAILSWNPAEGLGPNDRPPRILLLYGWRNWSGSRS